MNARELYYYRKDNGLCTMCGKEKDTSITICAKCKDYKRIYDKEYKEKAKLLGFCPKCRKNKLFGDEKSCPECRARDNSYSEKRYRNFKEIEKKRTSACRRKRAEKRKEQGLCTTCGKKLEVGTQYATCYGCRYKKRMKRHDYTKLNRSERVKNGLCYICGDKAEKGFGVCEKHHQMYYDMKIKNDDNYWRKLNYADFSKQQNHSA